MSDKIICSHTGKEISGYDGVISVKVELESECRFFIFDNIKLSIIDGELDVEKSFPNLDEYNIEDLFPKITAQIVSPFFEDNSDNRTELLLKDNSLEKEIGETINVDKSWVFQDSSLSDAESNNETVELNFELLYLKSTYGKYRGFMEINFKDISNTHDLLEVVEENLFEEYEWYETAEDVVWNLPQLLHGFKN